MSGKPGGQKHDQKKLRLELLSPAWLWGVAAVLTFGSIKYDADNWREGISQRRLLGAAMRHLLAYLNGQDCDAETGLSHLLHASCCLMFAFELRYTHPELDDRWKMDPGMFSGILASLDDAADTWPEKKPKAEPAPEPVPTRGVGIDSDCPKARSRDKGKHDWNMGQGDPTSCRNCRQWWDGIYPEILLQCLSCGKSSAGPRCEFCTKADGTSWKSSPRERTCFDKWAWDCKTHGETVGYGPNPHCYHCPQEAST